MAFEPVQWSFSHLSLSKKSIRRGWSLAESIPSSKPQIQHSHERRSSSDTRDTSCVSPLFSLWPLPQFPQSQPPRSTSLLSVFNHFLGASIFRPATSTVRPTLLGYLGLRLAGTLGVAHPNSKPFPVLVESSAPFLNCSQTACTARLRRPRRRHLQMAIHRLSAI